MSNKKTYSRRRKPLPSFQTSLGIPYFRCRTCLHPVPAVKISNMHEVTVSHHKVKPVFVPHNEALCHPCQRDPEKQNGGGGNSNVKK